MSNDGSPIEPTIRRAQESDYITVCRHQKMVHAAHAAQMPDRFRPPQRTDFTYLQFRSCLTGPNLLLIAEFGGEPAGSLLAVIDDVRGGLGFQLRQPPIHVRDGSVLGLEVEELDKISVHRHRLSESIVSVALRETAGGFPGSIGYAPESACRNLRRSSPGPARGADG